MGNPNFHNQDRYNQLLKEATNLLFEIEQNLLLSVNPVERRNLEQQAASMIDQINRLQGFATPVVAVNSNPADLKSLQQNLKALLESAQRALQLGGAESSSATSNLRKPRTTPPTGTVTFLFTDIEGSTSLWEQYPDKMRLALARHNTILRDAIEANDGYVFKTIGDAFCAAFASPRDALEAAIEAQRALFAPVWHELGLPQGVGLRVRMGLHTGTAEEETENDYFGPVVNRVARLMSAGRGGQVLLSLSTQVLVRDRLPNGAELRDLGEHRLKDLVRPEQIYQLVIPGLPDEFDPLRTLDNLPNNLPLSVTSFIGRDQDVAEIKRLLGTTRLLTILGSGGVGKTRLSLHIAAEILDKYPDGAWFIELAPLTNPALVTQAVAAVLGVREEPNRLLLQTLTEYLRSKQLLLVLDNCEHLLAAAAIMAENIQRRCLNVRILLTSREALGIAGERIFRVSPLSTPDPRQLRPATKTDPIAYVSQFEAARLFIERALAADPKFKLTAQNAAALARICRELDGIPLAIELAAARVRGLTVEQVAKRLNDRFRLFTGGSRTASLPHHQTLEALIDWSYDLLSKPEQVVLRRLAVFAGGWTLQAAEAVCTGDGVEEEEVLELLLRLVDKSLVVDDEQKSLVVEEPSSIGEQQARYRLLGTIRQYALQKLTEAGEGEAVRHRHARYYLGLIELGAPELGGERQSVWLERLEQEHDNLRAVLNWALEAEGNSPEAIERIETTLRLGSGLWWFWNMRCHYNEGRQWLDKTLAKGVGISTELRAKVLRGAGTLAHIQGDDAQAQALFNEGLALCRQLGDKGGVASILGSMARVEQTKGNYARSHALYEECLALERELGNKRGTAFSLNYLGELAYEQGDYSRAQAFYRESLALRRELSDKRGIAVSLNNLSEVAYDQHDYEQAKAYCEESRSLFKELGDKRGIAATLNNLGEISKAQGQYLQATALYEESLDLLRDLSEKRGTAMVLVNLGNIAHNQGNYRLAAAYYEESLTLLQLLGSNPLIAQALAGLAGVVVSQKQRPESGQVAARLLGATDALLKTSGVVLEPADRADYDRKIEHTRAQLDEGAFAMAWDEGKAMPLNEAIAYALNQGA